MGVFETIWRSIRESTVEFPCVSPVNAYGAVPFDISGSAVGPVVVAQRGHHVSRRWQDYGLGKLGVEKSAVLRCIPTGLLQAKASCGQISLDSTRWPSED